MIFWDQSKNPKPDETCQRCWGSGKITLPSPRAGPNALHTVLVWRYCDCPEGQSLEAENAPPAKDL